VSVSIDTRGYFLVSECKKCMYRHETIEEY
jgi:hypothetical protein